MADNESNTAAQETPAPAPTVVDELKAKFGDAITALPDFRGELAVSVPKEKLIDVNFIPQLPGFVADMIGKVETNLNLNTALEMLAKREEYSSYEIHSAALTDKNVLISGRSSSGQYVLQPRAGEGNWSQIQTYIQEALISTQSAQLATTSAKLK